VTHADHRCLGRSGAGISTACVDLRRINMTTPINPHLPKCAKTCAAKPRRCLHKPRKPTPPAGYRPLRNFLHRECKFLREYFADIYFSRRQEARNILTHCKTSIFITWHVFCLNRSGHSSIHVLGASPCQLPPL